MEDNEKFEESFPLTEDLLEELDDTPVCEKIAERAITRFDEILGDIYLFIEMLVIAKDRMRRIASEEEYMALAKDINEQADSLVNLRSVFG